MSYVRIVVNEKVLFDGDFSQWSTGHRNSSQTCRAAQAGAIQKPEPHMLAVMSTFGTAVASQTDVVMEVSTGPGWWTLNVKEH